jgi:glutamate-5-semialdehyde dehydrogenase
MDKVRLAARAAKVASRRLATLETARKNSVLHGLADAIERERAHVLAANVRDMQAGTSAGLSGPKLQRLALSEKSLGQLAAGLRQVAQLPDPVGQVTKDTRVESGLRVRKLRAPLGVIAMIYEARPGVTVDAFALCLKAGNACVLRGGKEAQHTNAALTELAHAALEAADVPRDALVNMSGTSREALETLLTLTGEIDLVIPRGGVDLIRFVHERSRIPTIQHFQGVCHIFVDESAEVERAVKVCVSAKTSAPATCNALECVLVHKNAADAVVPRLVDAYRAAGVEVRGSPLVQALAQDVRPATPEDFGKEFLDLVVAMRVVQGIEEAIEHIATYGSSHTDAILTGDLSAGGSAERFVREVGSSCVLVNASTRFNDGFQLGLGAEIGISTSRIHAYGPMGLEELTTQRWVVEGEGQVR